jgi:hypothetical protein
MFKASFQNCKTTLNEDLGSFTGLLKWISINININLFTKNVYF